MIHIEYTIIFSRFDLFPLVEENMNFSVEILDFLTIKKFLQKVQKNHGYNIRIITGKNFESIEFLNRIDSLLGISLLEKAYISEELYNLDTSNILFFQGKISITTGNIKLGKILLIKPSKMIKKRRFLFF